jgi:beta-lactamase class D
VIQINNSLLTFLAVVISVQTLLPIQPVSSMPMILAPPKADSSSSQNINFGRHFQELEVEGSILIYDQKNNRTYQHNPERNATAFLPASTFKILNSLVAIETGVIADENTIMKWDGVERKIPAWNHDLNMREAIKLSAYWVYQELARLVGYEQMQKLVSLAGYGNQQIGKEEDIDKFWLQGELRINAQQQIQFLRRFYNNDLPFAKRSLSIVKDMLIVEKTSDYTFSGKSGWVGFEGEVTPQIGWYVGYLEKAGNVYFFATNIEIRNPKDALARMMITRNCLKDIGLL